MFSPFHPAKLDISPSLEREGKIESLAQSGRVNVKLI